MNTELGISTDSRGRGLFSEADYLAHRERFSEGQFIGDRRAANFGICVTMRTSQPPTDEAVPWIEAIGDNSLAAHVPDGDWLYIVLLAVHPSYRRHGMASALIRACRSLAVVKNMRGIYAIPLLTGYHRFSEKMDVEEYARKVIWGDLTDPLVSLFLKRGFFQKYGFRYTVTDYFAADRVASSGVLVSWENRRFEQDS
ncbi:MAG: GNAT family N-acetyltransferase [Chloroflexi bacterium]|nr:GNAT family N-acetyltransferase [Chloroflexota bacterium]